MHSVLTGTHHIRGALGYAHVSPKRSLAEVCEIHPTPSE